MKVLWIGTYASGDYLNRLRSEGTYIQNAANNVQQYYIETLEKQYHIDVFSALVTRNFPNGKMIVKSNREKLKNGIIMNVGFLNIPYINQYIQKISLGKLIKKYIKNLDKDETLIVFVYALRIPFLYVASVLKKTYPNVTVINIVPDLPQYMYTGEKKKSKIKLLIQEKIINKYRRNVDGYVLYTKPMADYLLVPDNKYIVVEGIYADKKYEAIKTINQTKIILYAGGISKNYGVELLVQGFLDAALDNVELHIYGDGDYAQEIREISQRNKSIIYGGMISPVDAYKKMCEADLLVNPRPSKNSFTKYSCPSKILEYMATGTPTLLTKLEGIPSEYFDYVYMLEDESQVGVATTLREIFSIPEKDRLDKGKKAKNFIINNKNATNQVNKIMKFAETLSECSCDTKR